MALGYRFTVVSDFTGYDDSSGYNDNTDDSESIARSGRYIEHDGIRTCDVRTE